MPVRALETIAINQSPTRISTFHKLDHNHNSKPAFETNPHIETHRE